MESKKDIRRRVLAERNFITEKEWREKSHRIYEKVVTHPFFLHAEEIYCYVDYKNEVATRDIIETAWNLGKKVAAPKIVSDVMEFYYIHDFKELASGYCQIMEPVTRQIANGDNVMVIMPGAAFDKSRNRIGYGRGFYDHYLEKHTGFHTLALAFELQFVENIPVDQYDVKPEVIVTEDKIYV